jgi:hypothetical protein
MGEVGIPHNLLDANPFLSFDWFSFRFWKIQKKDQEEGKTLFADSCSHATLDRGIFRN